MLLGVVLRNHGHGWATCVAGGTAPRLRNEGDRVRCTRTHLEVINHSHSHSLPAVCLPPDAVRDDIKPGKPGAGAADSGQAMQCMVSMPAPYAGTHCTVKRQQTWAACGFVLSNPVQPPLQTARQEEGAVG
jgi:hypothetical protein